MSLRILTAGLLDTIQDQGRYGFGATGLNPSGAMDPAALTVANLLTGNAPGTAALEMHFPAPVIFFAADALFALSGADFDPHLDDQPIPAHTPVLTRAGAILTFRRPVWGAWCYLTVHGGFRLTSWMGSCSTHLAAQCGGWQGRKLCAGDALPFQGYPDYSGLLPGKGHRLFPWRGAAGAVYPAEPVIRFLPGPEYPLLDEPSGARLETSAWRVARQADRMGYPLDGPLLALRQPLELISTGVIRGTLQLLPNGRVLILMADCQTTGGYPRIGCVIGADLPVLAQIRPGQRVRLQCTDLPAAYQEYRAQQQTLRQLKWGCIFRLREAGLLARAPREG